MIKAVSGERAKPVLTHLPGNLPAAAERVLQVQLVEPAAGGDPKRVLALASDKVFEA